MKAIIASAVAAAIVMAAGASIAAEAKGKVASINGNTRMVKVDDKDYYFPTNTTMTGFAVGDTVTVTFDVLNNRNVVTKVAR